MTLQPPVTNAQKTWAVGLMTVPERRHDLLPNTIRSLITSGFTPDRLFVDGARDHSSWEKEFGTEVTVRYPRLNVCGNWILGMEELFMRHPQASHLLMVQDDVLFPVNLRAYLDKVPYPTNGYWNLYTASYSSQVPPPSQDYKGFYLSNQLGRGALALAFSRPVLALLLEHRDIINRANRDSDNDKLYGWRKIDGGIVLAMRKAGCQEWIHSPSLCQHTGTVSTIDKRQHSHGTDETFPKYHWSQNSPCWKGEDFDCLSLLPTG